MKKTKVAVLFGGVSVEHEISVMSARNVIRELDKEKYEVLAIGVDKSGAWRLFPEMIPTSLTSLMHEPNHPDQLLLMPSQNNGGFFHRGKFFTVDLIFPVVHGNLGEDGCLQGVLRHLNIPCVGAGVLGSALGMDKEVGKTLLKLKGIPVTDFCAFTFAERSKLTYDMIADKLGPQFFVKPVSQGSSVGVNRIYSREEFDAAVDDAFTYEDRVLFERRIKGREIEFSVIGNDDPKVSLPGEVIPKDGFYSYERKYFDDEGARVVIPADLPETALRKMQAMVKDAYLCLHCADYARVDTFYVSENEFYINELNSLPGFTRLSIYPKLWIASGMTYSQMLDEMIVQTMKRYAGLDRVKYSFERLEKKA